MTDRRFRDRRGRKTDWYKTHSGVSVVYGWDMERVPGELSVEDDNGSTWADVEAVWPRLHREERVVLQLVREGKTPTDVAEILNLPTRFEAHREVMRAVKVVQFYARWADTLERLPGCSLRPKDRRVAILHAKHRMPYREIAKRVEYANPKHVHVVLKRVKDVLREAGEDQVADMLTECGALGMLRDGRGENAGATRRADMDEPWRGDAGLWLVENMGKVWYEWGSQDIDKGVADCSGLVIEVLKKFGVLPGGFRDMTAQGLAKHFDKTTKNPKVCDLAFYGRSTKDIVHVMFFMGNINSHKDMVAGMCGGRRNMTAKWARRVGASLWLRKMKYRRDYLYCRRVR